MRDDLDITVWGAPHAQKRPRADGRGKFARIYKDKKQMLAEQSFVGQVAAQLPFVFDRFDGPIELIVHFFLGRPKSHYGTGKNAKRLKPSAPLYPTVYPDFDNTIKHLCDCCNNLVWNDDRQVVRARIRKDYTEERPHTRFVVRELLHNE